MDTSSQTFAYAEASIAAQRQRMIAGASALVVIMAPYALTSIRFAALLLGLLMLWIVPITYLQTRWMLHHFRRMRLHLLPEGLMRESGTQQEVIPWTAIRRLRVRLQPNDQPRAVEVYTRASRPVTLAGFEHMEALVRGIEAHVPRAIIETKRGRLNWDHPGVVFGFMVCTGLSVGALLRLGGHVVIQNINLVILFGAGLMWLSYAPLSRQNPNFRPYEVGIGSLFIGLAIFSLLLIL